MPQLGRVKLLSNGPPYHGAHWELWLHLKTNCYHYVHFSSIMYMIKIFELAQLVLWHYAVFRFIRQYDLEALIR